MRETEGRRPPNAWRGAAPRVLLPLPLLPPLLLLLVACAAESARAHADEPRIEAILSEVDAAIPILAPEREAELLRAAATPGDAPGAGGAPRLKARAAALLLLAGEAAAARGAAEAILADPAAERGERYLAAYLAGRAAEALGAFAEAELRFRKVALDYPEWSEGPLSLEALSRLVYYERGGAPLAYDLPAQAARAERRRRLLEERLAPLARRFDPPRAARLLAAAHLPRARVEAEAAVDRLTAASLALLLRRGDDPVRAYAAFASAQDPVFSRAFLPSVTALARAAGQGGRTDLAAGLRRLADRLASAAAGEY